MAAYTAGLLPGIKVNVMIATTQGGSSGGTTSQSSTDSTGGEGGSGVLDMSEYEGVLFIGLPTVVTAGGVLGISPKFGSSSGTLTADTSAFAGTTASTTGMSEQSFVLDIIKPLTRYVGVQATKATQAAGMTVLGIQYGAHKIPVDTWRSTGTGGYAWTNAATISSTDIKNPLLISYSTGNNPTTSYSGLSS
jgi:hypothetical protein